MTSSAERRENTKTKTERLRLQPGGGCDSQLLEQ